MSKFRSSVSYELRTAVLNVMDHDGALAYGRAAVSRGAGAAPANGLAARDGAATLQGPPRSGGREGGEARTPRSVGALASATWALRPLRCDELPLGKLPVDSSMMMVRMLVG